MSQQVRMQAKGSLRNHMHASFFLHLLITRMWESVKTAAMINPELRSCRYTLCCRTQNGADNMTPRHEPAKR